jgi:hypothetical protein
MQQHRNGDDAKAEEECRMQPGHDAAGKAGSDW